MNNKNTTLALSLCNNDKFALGKGTMDPVIFKKLIESLVMAFKEAYQNSYNEYVEILQKESDFFLLIVQKKVPNVTKAIIEHPKLPSIQIAIKGRDSNGNTKIEILKSPFNQNQCKSVIPYYNNLHNKLPDNYSNQQTINKPKNR